MQLSKLIPVLLLGLLACQKPSDAVIPGDPSTGQPVSTGGTPTDVGQPIGTVTSQTIGSTGGTINLPDGSLTLTFPAGAVSKETVITIQPIENKAHQGAGKTYRFGPDGTQFSKPVTMTWHYEDAAMNGSAPEALAIAFQDKQGVWMGNSNVQIDKAARTVSAQLPHFSDWSYVFKYVIISTAGVTNVVSSDGTEISAVYLTAAESTKIYIAATYDPHNDPGKDSYWAMDKPYVMSSERIISWQINGKTNPNYAEEGQLTIDPHYAQALYSAPPRRPEVNPVAVAAEINPGVQGKLTLIQYVSINPHATVTVAGSTDDNPNVQLTLFGTALYGSITDATGTKLSLTFIIKNFHGNGTYAVDKEHTTTIMAMQVGNIPYGDYYIESPSGKWVSGGGKVVISGYDAYNNVVIGAISGTLFLAKENGMIPKPISASFQGKAISTEIPSIPGLGG